MLWLKELAVICHNYKNTTYANLYILVTRPDYAQLLEPKHVALFILNIMLC